MSLKFDIMTLHFLPEDATHTTQDRDPVLVSPARPLLGTISPEKAVSRYQQIGKRTLECLIILLCMPLILPILLAAALAVSLDGHSPLYIQRRVGRGGREFRMLKLRTMVPGAKGLLESHLASDPAAAAEWERDQKLKDDPRITRIGHFLRKTSIDELPQVFNVLFGTMALVGPRPMMPCQKDSYKGTAYYDLRPGITGLWQISDRNESAFGARVYYDELYKRVMSLRTDLMVLTRTVTVVLRGTGY